MVLMNLSEKDALHNAEMNMLMIYSRLFLIQLSA